MITLDSPEPKTFPPKTYYTTGQTIMDDHTYDTLEDILRKNMLK